MHFLVHVTSHLGLLALLIYAAHGFGSIGIEALKLDRVDDGERLLFAQALGFGMLSLVMLGLGTLRLFYPSVAWLTIGSGILLAVRRGWPAWQRPRSSARAHSQIDWLVLLVLGGIVMLALGYTLLANALAPPHSYDAVAYHLAIPKLYIKAHRIIYIPYMVYSNWPLGAEMLFTLGLLLGSEVLAQLLTWWMAILIGGGLLALAHGRLPNLTGPLAVAVFFSVPMVLSLAGTGLIEIPLTCYVFLAIYAFWRWRETAAPGWFVLSALLSGCAAATKLNGAAIAIVLGFGVLVSELMARRPARAMRLFVWYGLLSFLVVLPWYGKSWMLAGDPLWPFLLPVFNGQDWDALGTEYLLGYLRTTNLAPTLKNWLLAPWYLTTNGEQFGSFLLGPYLMVLLPFVLAPALANRKLRSLLGSLALISVSMYSIWFFLTHQTRFLMPVVPSMALLVAAGITWFWQARFGLLRWTARLVPLVWLLSGTWLLKAEYRREWAHSWPYLAGTMDRDTYLAQVFEDYPVFRYINTALPGDATVLLTPFDVRGYYLDRSYIWLNPIGQRFIRLESLPDTAAFGNRLRQLGVTHVLYNTQHVFPNIRFWEHDAGLLSSLVTTYGTPIYMSGPSQLYELQLEGLNSSR